MVKLALFAVAVLGMAGCAAGTKPCMIIPAQIEIAQDVREAARGRMEQRKVDLTRIQSTLEQNRTRLARLQEERDQLKREVGSAPAEENKQ